MGEAGIIIHKYNFKLEDSRWGPSGLPFHLSFLFKTTRRKCLIVFNALIINTNKDYHLFSNKCLLSFGYVLGLMRLGSPGELLF